MSPAQSTGSNWQCLQGAAELWGAIDIRQGAGEAELVFPGKSLTSWPDKTGEAIPDWAVINTLARWLQCQQMTTLVSTPQISKDRAGCLATRPLDNINGARSTTLVRHAAGTGPFPQSQLPYFCPSSPRFLPLPSFSSSHIPTQIKPQASLSPSPEPKASSSTSSTE